MTALIEGVAGGLAGWGPSIVARATITLVLMLVVVAFSRKTRASVRHLVLTTGFGALLVLPVAQWMVPSVRVEIVALPVALEEYIARPPVMDGPVPEHANPLASSGTVLLPPDRRWRPTAAVMLTTLWIAGVVVFALPVVVGGWQARRLRWSGRRWRQGEQLIEVLAREAGVRRRVDVVRHDTIVAPAVCGTIRPVILFPSDAATWSTEHLVRAAVHEVEHVRRADCLISTVARLICAVYWFHPLVWVAWQRLGLEAERACDDAAVRNADATGYADQLVSLASRMAPRLNHPLLAMANRSHLARRVAALLDERQARGRAGRTIGAGIALIAATVIIIVSSLELVRAVQEFELDVVSVRETGGGLSRPGTFEPGRMVLPNRDVEALVRFAFGLHPSDPWGPRATDQQIEGWPDPHVAERRFTLTATYAGARVPPLTVQQRLVREILTDRFGLRTHVEQRKQPVYALRLIEPGVLGAGIREVDYDCTDPQTRARRDCRRGDREDERGTFFRGSGPMAAFVARLQLELRDRIVVDQTGLDGFYEWELLWMERSRVPRHVSEIHRPFAELLPLQMGMTLEATYAPVDIVVIDAISMPMAN